MKWMMFLFLLLFIACNSDKREIEINFNANPVADSVKYWEIYIEHRPTNTGFTIKDSMEYTTKLKPFYLGKIYNTGKTTIKYPTKVRKEYIVVGIIANNDIRSVLSASKVIKIDNGLETVWIK